MHAILASLFLQGGIAVMGNPVLRTSGYDYQHVVNPYGTIEAGFDHDLGPWNISLYGRHISSIATAKDNGADTVELTIKVHPFAR